MHAHKVPAIHAGESEHSENLPYSPTSVPPDRYPETYQNEEILFLMKEPIRGC